METHREPVVPNSKTKTTPFSDDRQIEDLIAQHKGSQKDLGVESRLRLSYGAQRGYNVSIGALAVKENTTEHGELEVSYGPLGFILEAAKDGGESTREGDDDSLDKMVEAKKSWSMAKQLGCCSEDEEGVLKTLAKFNRRSGKEPKSRKKRKHKRKVAKEV